MFLERCGKLFFSQIRPLFFFVLIAFPLLGSGLFLYQEQSKINDLEERFARAARKEKSAIGRKERKERFLKRYSNADPYFIDTQIEGFSLLQNEKRLIESLLSHPAFPESKHLKERLSFIQQNRLSFAEDHIAASTSMKEVEEKQRHPVQMDECDLKSILCLIEDVAIDSPLELQQKPQILIKEFQLKRRETPLHTEIFEVEMDLVKREFIKK